MRTRKKILRTTLALAIGSVLLWPEPGRTMDAADAPETVEISSLSRLYSGVEFNHSMHAEIASCVECHHHTTGGEVTDPNCIRCHAKSGEADTVSCQECHSSDRFSKEDLSKLDNPQLYHIDKPGLKSAYHLNCVGCHQKTGGPTGCQDCHTMTEAGEKMFQTGKHAPAGATGGEHGGH
ncbi:MAG: cytochrome c3 family protein [Pseudomonadota bacterium]